MLKENLWISQQKKKKMFSLQIESLLRLSTSKKHQYNTSHIEYNAQHIISW